jgi:hypothetical protein
MKRARTGIIAAAILAVATIAMAQAKPDFSGSWAPEGDAAAAGGGGGRGMGGPMTVKQTATELTVERQGRNGQMSTTYKLDGSESKISMGQMEGTATAKWEGNKLVITTKAGDNTSTQTWSLDGGVLTIERTGGRGPGKMTYKKST